MIYSAEKIAEFLAQPRIVVVGLSSAMTDDAKLIYHRLKETGHTVYVVNPDALLMEGEPSYPDVKSIPQRPGGVIIVGDPDVASRVVHDCAEAMIQHVWLHNAATCGGTCPFTATLAYCEKHGIEVITTLADETVAVG